MIAGLTSPAPLASLRSPWSEPVRASEARLPAVNGDAVTLSTRCAEPAVSTARPPLLGALLAAVMLPSVLGAALTAAPALAHEAPRTQCIERPSSHRTPIVEDADTFRLPRGTEKIVFGKGKVVVRDAKGGYLGAEPYPAQLLTSTLHARPAPAEHAMLTQASDGRIEVHVPTGTARLQITSAHLDSQQHARFDGAVYALDAAGNILAEETASDVRLSPAGSRPPGQAERVTTPSAASLSARSSDPAGRERPEPPRDMPRPDVARP
ncbi:MAG: hypothetical protein EB084_08885 [Proteobacteria bacterium]|nr:hypothetical protein [Pseudomonadota bacterium]